jgi:hypothetical protein
VRIRRVYKTLTVRFYCTAASRRGNPPDLREVADFLGNIMLAQENVMAKAQGFPPDPREGWFL